MKSSIVESVELNVIRFSSVDMPVSVPVCRGTGQGGEQPEPVKGAYILLESGGYMLLESGGKIMLEE